MDKKTKTTEFDSTGDTILVVGKGEHTQRLRVSSTTLRKASKVFDAMLDSNFTEGQGLGSSDAPKEVVLSDDSPQSMRIICAHLHFENEEDEVPRTMTSALLLRTAQIIDKYFLQKAMAFATDKWLEFVEIQLTLKDMENKWHAARLLDRPKVMKRLTKALVLYQADCYHTSFDSGITGDMTGLATALTKKREALRTDLMQALHQIMRYTPKSGSCICKLEYTGRLTQRMYSDTLEPRDIVKLPLAISLAKTEKIGFPQQSDHLSSCKYSLGECLKRMKPMEDTFKAEIDTIKKWDGTIDWKP